MPELSDPTFERLRYYFNRCRPDVAIEADDPHSWYVDFDAMQLRGERCISVMAGAIRLTDGPTCQLFTGFPGSGKTSELLRLVRTLETERRFVVYADALDTVDTNNPIESADILLAIGLATDQKLVQATSFGPEAEWVNRFANEIKDLLFSNVTLNRLGLKVGAGGIAATEVGLELKANPSFRRELRTAANNRRRQFLDQVRTFFAHADSKLRKAGFEGGLVVILDNLEKLSPDQDVLDSARNLFLRQVDALRAPSVHLIYTIPPELVFAPSGVQLGRLFDGEPLVLPMVKVCERRDGSAHQRGRDALREVLERRLDFKEVFEGREDSVEALIGNCGGYPRDLLRLCRYALQSANDLPVRIEHAQAACKRLRRSYEHAYSTADLPLLRYVGANRPKKIPEEFRQRIEEVVKGNFVMVYGNDAEWYDLHPLVARLLAEIEVEERGEER